LAEAANRAKGDFLANMSHELRTPLAAVIGFADILHKNRGNRLAAADLLYVTRIQDNGRHLLRLISEILDLAKLEAGRIEVVLAPAELRDLIRQATMLLEGRSEKATVRLALELPAHSCWIETDEGRLTQVLINLISNAVKFTDEGVVTVRLRTDGRIGGGARIEVADTGIGIPADRLEAIFRPFEQVDSTASRVYDGTGLGLAIAQSLASALGGSLSVTSMLGIGSTFALDLPNEWRRTRDGMPAPVALAVGD
jgi:signal transduction histidine kinase